MSNGEGNERSDLLLDVDQDEEEDTQPRLASTIIDDQNIDDSDNDFSDDDIFFHEMHRSAKAPALSKWKEISQFQPIDVTIAKAKRMMWEQAK